MSEIDTERRRVEALRRANARLAKRAAEAERGERNALQSLATAEALLKTCEAANESLQDLLLVAEAEVERLRADADAMRSQRDALRDGKPIPRWAARATEAQEEGR